MTANCFYPISGFWSWSESQGWPKTLDDIHSIGASKVIQFGPVLNKEGENTDNPEKASEEKKAREEFKKKFANCKINGEHGYDATLGRITQLNASASIRNYYSFITIENFGDDLLANDFDQKVLAVADTTCTHDAYWILVVPTSDPTAKVAPEVKEYDFILVCGNQDDSVTKLLTEASKPDRRMDVYIGMPTMTNDPKEGGKVLGTAIPIFFELLNRVLASYRCRHYSQQSFVGVYQSFELQIPWPDSGVISTLQKQHSLVRIMLPRKKILISPYFEARKKTLANQSVGPLTPESFNESVKDGFKRIALANIDIIAPQDGRGTGKVGLFWPYEENIEVPAEIQPAVGQTTYGEAYYANTRELYQLCREVVDELRHDTDCNTCFNGQSIELWANVEAFEPSDPPPQSVFDLLRTTKERLDHALTFDGTHCSDQISFMWNGLYDSGSGPASKPLQNQIQLDWRRPIVVDAFEFTSNQKGIIIRGFGVADAKGKISLSYYDSKWQPKSIDIPVLSGWSNPDFGQHFNRDHHENRFHSCLQEAWVPFSWADMAPNFWLHIKSTNASGDASNHFFSVKY